MKIPIRWILEDINEAMRTDETRKKLDNNEPTSLKDSYPLMWDMIILFLVFLLWCSLRCGLIHEVFEIVQSYLRGELRGIVRIK